jgi:ABC-type phosphate/phosphonate transport system ATPase subunit
MPDVIVTHGAGKSALIHALLALCQAGARIIRERQGGLARRRRDHLRRLRVWLGGHDDA